MLGRVAKKKKKRERENPQAENGLPGNRMITSRILRDPVLPQNQLSLDKELLEPPYSVSVLPD